jgi:hypothetical protein
MSDRAKQLRRRAAECLFLSRKAISQEVRVGLITMAQKLYEWAVSEATRIGRSDLAVEIVEDRQMRRH